MVRINQRQFREHGHRVVSQLLRQRDWKLVPDVDRFVEEVLASFKHLQSDVDDAETVRKLIVREATRRYCVVLYESSRADGTQRQQRAFEELWAYFFPIALYKTGDEEQANDYAQAALIRVWEKSDQCTDPGRFLGWAKVVLVNEVRMGLRRRKKEQATIAWPESGEEGQETLWEQVMEATSKKGRSPRSLEEDVVKEEMTRRLSEALGVVLRSEAQRTVIEGLFIKGLGFGAIAEMLGTTPSNVYTLKSRALARLRRDERFRRVLTELLEE